MPGPAGTRTGLTTVLPGDGVTAYRTVINAIRGWVEANATPSSSGVLGSRPTSTPGSPGVTGRLYHATDVGLTFRDTGTGWVPVGIPIGGYLAWAGDNDLTPELVRADGRLVDRTTYSGFFTQFGHRFNGGADPGSNQVRLPNALGRTLIGAGAGAGLTARTVGQLLGEETHALTSAENGPHTHTAGSEAATGSGSSTAPSSILWGGHNGTYAGGARYATIVDSSGSGTPHNTMQPSAVATILVRII